MRSFLIVLILGVLPSCSFAFGWSTELCNNYAVAEGNRDPATVLYCPREELGTESRIKGIIGIACRKGMIFGTRVIDENEGIEYFAVDTEKDVQFLQIKNKEELLRILKSHGIEGEPGLRRPTGLYATRINIYGLFIICTPIFLTFRCLVYGTKFRRISAILLVGFMPLFLLYAYEACNETEFFIFVVPFSAIVCSILIPCKHNKASSLMVAMFLPLQVLNFLLVDSQLEWVYGGAVILTEFSSIVLFMRGRLRVSIRRLVELGRKTMLKLVYTNIPGEYGG